MEGDLTASVAFLSGGVLALHSEHGACPVEVAAEHGACSAPDLTLMRNSSSPGWRHDM